MRPQNIQNFHFSVKTRPAGAIPLTVFENFQGFFNTPNYPTSPQNIKNFHFLVKTRPAGATPLTVFENFQGFLYA